MGITSFSKEIIERHKKGVKSVIELGAQNMYCGVFPFGTYADVYYRKMGIEYQCIDLNGENSAQKIDLSKSFEIPLQFDMVTDFGTSEHVAPQGKHDPAAFYNCWKSKHDLLKMGGIMINENPKTGNWPGHGFNYHTIYFYKSMRAIYEILEIGEHPAMGNTKDGWNVYAVLRKKAEQFLTFDEFSKLNFKDK